MIQLIKKSRKIILFIYNITLLIVKILISDKIFFFPHYHTGGAEKVHLDILKYLNNKNNLVIFTNKSHSNHYLKEFKNYSKIFELNEYKGNKFTRKIVTEILKIFINTSKPILFSCNNSFFYDLIQKLNSKIVKIDLLHAFTYPDKGGAEIYSLNRVEFLNKRIVINQKTKNDYEELYKKHNINKKYLDRIEIINISVNVPKIIPKKKYKKEKLEVIYCGRIAKEKRVDLIIDVANKTIDYINFSIYGPIEIEIKNINNFYKKNIIVETEKNIVYQNADILILTSYREGFPIVIKEAMANGIVCISTNVGSISEHLNDRKNGFLLKSVNPNEIIYEITEILHLLYKDRNLLKSISENAYDYALKNFDTEKFKLQINKVFE